MTTPIPGQPLTEETAVTRAHAYLERLGVQTLYDDHPAVIIGGLLRLIEQPSPQESGARPDDIEYLRDICAGVQSVGSFEVGENGRRRIVRLIAVLNGKA